MSAASLSPRAFPVAELFDDEGVVAFAHPVDEDVASPFEEENRFAATLGLYGPHLMAGRLAAHSALAALGEAPRPLLRTPTGEVAWPAGFVGTISHTKGLAVAVLAPADRFYGVGVDVERRDRTLDEGTRRLLSRPEEHAWLDAPPPLPGHPLLLLASAKEVVFKVYFPASGVRLHFDEATIEPQDEGHLVATVLRPLGLPPRLDIRCLTLGEHLVLGAALPR
jgi:4'-phosphopantetheinyl transferase EntD